MFGRATILTDRQTDRLTKSVFLWNLFIYSVIQYKTAGGGDFQKGCNAFSWVPAPAVFLRASYEQRSCRRGDTDAYFRLYRAPVSGNEVPGGA